MIKTITCFLLVFLFVIPPSFAHTKKSSYHKAFKRWNRHQELYQREDFYASISWNVVLLSDSFLDSMADEVARIYNYGPEESDHYLRGQKEKYGGHPSFFVSFYAYDPTSSDLSVEKTVWKIRLLVDGKRFEPVRVDKISSPTPLDKVLFSFIRPWADHYYLHFPEVDLENAQDVSLTIHGPNAKGSLDWTKSFSKK